MTIDGLTASPHFHDVTMRNKRHLINSPDNNEIVNELKITPEMFLQLCPALIVQIDGHDCEDDPEPTLQPSYFQGFIILVVYMIFAIKV